MTDETGAVARFDGNVRTTWDGGGIVDMRLSATGALNGWTVDVDLGGEIVNIWNAVVVSQAGTRYTLGPTIYNATVPAGTVVELGVEVAGDVRFEALDLAATVAAPEPVPEPVRDSDAGPDAAPGPEPLGDDADQAAAPERPAERLSPLAVHTRDPDAAAAPALFVEGDVVFEPAADGGRPSGPAPMTGPLSTRGAQIVDASGAPVSIHGINWFGLETEIFAPHGLWARNWRQMMDDAKALGFNTLRIPFSGELVEANGGTPQGIDFGLNPDLEGLNGLEILDALVGYAGEIELGVLLDYHRGAAGAGPNDNGLWFGQGRTEADVIAAWQAIAARYSDAPAVIGADLVNEPHGGTWGDGARTDWAAAAERIGNAVQAIAPDWLIVVEGVATYAGDTYWWGGNLQGVRERPVVLDRPNKVVYSPHDYPASVYPQNWFVDGTDLTQKFRENWGYIAEEGIAPVLLGEWGSRLETASDRAWAADLSAYLADNYIDWMWWSLNPNSGDTGGLYEDDWATVRGDVTTLLEPFLVQTRPGASAASAGDTAATFAVSLTAPAEGDIAITFATADGTASAGEDYRATAGTILFSAGDQEATVLVPLLPDGEREGDEFFYLVLTGPGSMRASGTARIEDRDRSGPSPTEPFVDVENAVFLADTAVARFRVVLSEPAPRDVTIGFVAGRDGAPASELTRSRLIIPQGLNEATLELDIGNDEAWNGAEPARYSLTLTSADGAELRTSAATGVVTAAPADAAELIVGGGASTSPQLTVDVILENDWGTGALFNIIIKNTSSDAVAGWQLGIDVPFDLTELWSAVLVSDVGDRLVVRNTSWNGGIAPGDAVDFGFIADDGGIGLAALLQGADLELLIE